MFWVIQFQLCIFYIPSKAFNLPTILDDQNDYKLLFEI